MFECVRVLVLGVFNKVLWNLLKISPSYHNGKIRGPIQKKEKQRLCPWVTIGFVDVVFINEVTDMRRW